MAPSQARECLQPGETCDALLLFTREGWSCQRLMAAAQAGVRQGAVDGGVIVKIALNCHDIGDIEPWLILYIYI